MKHTVSSSPSPSQCIGCCLVLICLLLYDGRAETSTSQIRRQLHDESGTGAGAHGISNNKYRSLGISSALSRALGGGGSGGGGIGAGGGGHSHAISHFNENEESIEKDSGETRPIPTIRKQTNLTASGKIICRKKRVSNRSATNANKRKGKGNVGKNPSKVSIKEIIRQFYIQSDPEPTYIVDALRISDPASLRTAGLLRVLIRSVTDLVAGIVEPLGINNAIFRPLAGSRGRVFGFSIGQRLYEVRMVTSRGKRTFTFQRLIVLKGYQQKHVLRRYVYENDESVECAEENQAKPESTRNNEEVNLLEWLNSGPNVLKIKWDFITGLKREPEKELDKRLDDIEKQEMQIRDRQLEDDEFVEQEIIRRAEKHKEKDPEEKDKDKENFKGSAKSAGKKRRKKHRLLGKQQKIEKGAATSLLQDVEEKARKILTINTFETEEDEPPPEDSGDEPTTEKTSDVLMKEVAIIDQELLALAPKIEKIKQARELQGPTLSFSEQQFLLEEERLLTAAYNSKKKELSQKLGLIDPNAKEALDQLPSQTVPTSVKLLAHKKKQHYAQGLILLNGFSGLKNAEALKDLVAFEKFRELLSQGKGEEQAVSDLTDIIMKAKQNQTSSNSANNNNNTATSNSSMAAVLEDVGLANLTGMVKSIGIDKLINPDYFLSLIKLGKLAVSAGEIAQNMDDLKKLNTLVESNGNLTALSELAEKAGSLKKLAILADSADGISNLLNVTNVTGGLKRLSHTVDKVGGVSQMEETLSSANKYLRLLKTTRSVASLLKLLKFTHAVGGLQAFSSAVEKLGGEKKLEEVITSGGGIQEFAKLVKAARGFVGLKKLAMKNSDTAQSDGNDTDTSGSNNSLQKLKEETGSTQMNVTKLSQSLQTSGDWSELQSIVKTVGAYTALVQLFEPTSTEREQEETTHYSRVIKESHGLANLLSLSEIAGGTINLIELSKETGGVEKLVLLSGTLGGLPQLLELAQRDGGLGKYSESVDQLSPLLSTAPTTGSNIHGLSSLITRDHEGFNGLAKLHKISNIYPILQKLEESKEREEIKRPLDFISNMGGIQNVLELNKTTEGNLKLQRYAKEHGVDLSRIHDIIADADDHFKLIQFVEHVGGVYYVQQLVDHAGGVEHLIDRSKRASLFEEMKEIADSAEALSTLEEAADAVGGLATLTKIVDSSGGLRKLKVLVETEEGQQKISQELTKIQGNSNPDSNSTLNSNAVLKLENVTKMASFWSLSEFVDHLGGLKKIKELAESTGGLKQLSVLSKQVDGLLNLKHLLEASGGLSKLKEAADSFGGLTELNDISKKAGGFDKLKQLVTIVGGFQKFQNIVERGGGASKLFTLTRISGGFAQLIETAKTKGALEKLTKLAEKKGGYTRLIDKVKKAGGLKIFVSKIGEGNKGKTKEAAGSQESSEES